MKQLIDVYYIGIENPSVCMAQIANPRQREELSIYFLYKGEFRTAQIKWDSSKVMMFPFSSWHIETVKLKCSKSDLTIKFYSAF